MPGTPLDVALWRLHDFLFDLQEFGHFIPGRHWMRGAPRIPVCAHWDSHTPGLHTSWPPRPLLLLRLRLLECLRLLLHLRLLLRTLLHALLLLRALSSSCCLSVLSLTLERPWSQFSCPSLKACSWTGCLWDQPVEKSWLIYVVPNPVGTTAT